MGDPKILSIQRIGNINAACASIGENDALDGTIAYRLGRLADYTDSSVRRVQKLHQEKLRAFRKKTEKMNEEQKKVESEKLSEEIQDLNDIDEEVKIPEFKYSDFVAKVDTIVGGKQIRAGQTLVPVKFFSLMGDLVRDDQGLIKGMLEPKEKSEDKKPNGRKKV